MPQSLSQIYVHLVFSTKNREPYIDERIAPELHAYIAAVLYDEFKSPAKIVGGVEDHAHILLNLSRTTRMSDVVEGVKTSSSKWMKKYVSSFAWQAGYGAFSVSQSNVEKVIQYIRDQREHHRKSEFKDELLLLLKRHNVEFDERYLWD